MEILKALFNEGSAYRCVVFAMVAWCLWQRQNRIRKHQPSWSLHDIGDKAKEMLGPTHRSPMRWSPLPKVNFKANFDAALFMGQAVLG